MEEQDYDQEYRRSNNSEDRSNSKSLLTRNHSNNGSYYLMMNNVVNPLISRSVRAKRRRAFLGTYKLSHLNNDSVKEESADSNCTEKLKQVATKFKSVVISVTSAARLSLLKRGTGCSFRPALCCVSLPSSSSIKLG